MDNNSKLLTIAIPTYNMEKLLNRCLNSLIVKDNDLFKQLEVLIVNDGSKDKSLDIALEYEQKYSGIFKVINKENGNYGSCINAALKIASGLYFRILDADDSFNTIALYELLKFISHNTDKEIDMILTNYQRVYSTGKIVNIKAGNIQYGKIYTPNELELYKHNVMVMHGITYKLKILKDSNYHQTEGISYTDTEFCFYPLSCVHNFVFLNLYLYKYSLGRDGQTVSIKSYQKNIHHLYIMIDKMLNYLYKNPNYNRDQNINIYKNQMKTLYRGVSTYYRIILSTKFKHNEDIASLDHMI